MFNHFFLPLFSFNLEKVNGAEKASNYGFAVFAFTVDHSAFISFFSLSLS